MPAGLAFMLGSGPTLGYFTAAKLTGLYRVFRDRARTGALAADLGDPSYGYPLARHVGRYHLHLAANLVVALTFLDLAKIMRHAGASLLYAAMTFTELMFAHVLVPETKGIEIESVQALWVKPAGGNMVHSAAPKLVVYKVSLPNQF